MGTERKSAFIDAKAKLATAYHEVCRRILEIPFAFNLCLGGPCFGSHVHRRSYASTQGHLYSSRPCSWLCKSRPLQLDFCIQLTENLDFTTAWEWPLFCKLQGIPRYHWCFYGWTSGWRTKYVFMSITSSVIDTASLLLSLWSWCDN